MIVFVHLLNDRSGSPRVLASVIRNVVLDRTRARLLVGSAGAGCLDEVGIPTQKYWYRRTSFRIATLITYLLSQAALFVTLLRMRDIPRDAVIYVNTLLPIGAALFGRITRRCVIYHLHEVSITPAPLRLLLVAVARLTASRLIYVSDSHRTCLPVPGVPAATVYNALDDEFLRDALASAYLPTQNGLFRVLMLASLRDYKGVPEYLNLASHFETDSGIEFVLVVNDDERDIERYFRRLSKPSNLVVHPRTSDPGAYYARASLVLNLSRPDQWIETFGLTLIESMAYGIPVIAPPVGGPAELVRDGKEGFLIDSRDASALRARVQLLRNDSELCLRLSTAARLRAQAFAAPAFARTLCTVIESTCLRT